MNSWRRIISIYVVLIFVIFGSNAQTIVPGGNVNGTWTVANSPYQVQADITVPDGDTLIVEPGTTVEFASNSRMTVDGRLLAIGNQVDTITFTAQNSILGWDGIDIDPPTATTDSSLLVYCKLEYAEGLLFVGIFDRVRIENCLFQYGEADFHGGALAAYDSDFILRNNVFRNNHADGHGGALSIGGGSCIPLITGNLFQNNSALGVGGAIRFVGNDFGVIHQNVFQGNTADLNGGCISLANFTNPTITENIFTNNSSNNSGGAIAGVVADPVVMNNQFYGNSASGDGGVYFFWSDSEPTLSGNYYEGNSSSTGSVLAQQNQTITNISDEVYHLNSGGSVIEAISQSQLHINNCIFTNNLGNRGGAIKVSTDGNVEVKNSLFVNNEAWRGGALSVTGASTPHFINCTFSNNHATNDGGMLHLYTGGSPTFSNCILHGNTSAGLGGVLYVQGGSTFSNNPNFVNCLIEGGQTGFYSLGVFNPTLSNTIDTIPQFVQPTAGSGVANSTLNSNWQLQSTSPCINAGTPDTTGLALPAFDLAGGTRVVLDTVDIGAYETQLAANVVSVFGDTNLCSNLDSVLFNVLATGIGPLSFQWQLDGVDLVGETNDTLVRSIILANQGDYRCIVTNAQGADTSLTITTTFYSVPPLSSLGADTAFCSGDSILLVADNGIYTYDWNNGLSTNDSIFVSNAGDYFYQVTDANNCTVMSDTISFTTNNLPVIDLGPDQVNCDSSLVQLGTPIENVTYNWNSGLSFNDSIDVNTTDDYVLVVTDSNGCMASDTVNVSFFPAATVDIVGDTLCQGQFHAMNPGSNYVSYNWNNGFSLGQVLNVSQTGTYFIEVVDANGCQAFDTTHVLFNSNPTPDLGNDTTICFGDSVLLDPGDAYFSYDWNNGFSADSALNVGSAGIWSVDIVDTNGCYGNTSITVSTNPVPSIFFGSSVITLCAGDSVEFTGDGSIATYNWNNGMSVADTFVVNTSGLVTVIAVDTNNCIADETIDVTALPPSFGTDAITSCDSYSWIDGNTYTSSNNSAQWTVTNSQGCDSLLTLDLTILNSTSGTDIITACNSYTWIDGNTYASSNNSAQWILTNAQGCDSVVTLDLTINSATANVTSNDPELIADPGATSYQWLDCLNGYAIIPGATSNSFIPTSNGEYAVVIEENGCLDTSTCFVINNVSISEIQSQNWKLYPNPTNGNVTLRFHDTPWNAMVEVTNTLGQNISKQEINASEMELNLGKENGIYFVRVISENREEVVPVVKL